MNAIDELLRSACGKEFTAAVVRIEHRGAPLFERAYGVTRADELASLASIPILRSTSPRSRNSSLRPLR